MYSALEKKFPVSPQGVLWSARVNSPDKSGFMILLAGIYYPEGYNLCTQNMFYVNAGASAVLPTVQASSLVLSNVRKMSNTVTKPCT